MQFEALVIGGSYAGLSAAMYIARGRHAVCVIDAGAPRNRFSPAAHGFFGQDGAQPADMIRTARAQLERYPNVAFVDDLATDTRPTPGGFTADLRSGREVSAAKMVIAVGISDTLPDVPGVSERWGKSVLHCPYCHGYEYGGQRLGVLALGPMSSHQALLIRNWGPTTYFLNGQSLDDDLRAQLHAKEITIEATPVAALEGDAPGLTGVRLADGRIVGMDALYVAPTSRPASPLAEQLGCAHDEGPLGPVVRVDGKMMTTVPGVYAAGDVARQPSNAMLAAAEGVRAGSSVSQALIFGSVS